MTEDKPDLSEFGSHVTFKNSSEDERPGEELADELEQEKERVSEATLRAALRGVRGQVDAIFSTDRNEGEVLRDLEITSVSLVPAEEAEGFQGGLVELPPGFGSDASLDEDKQEKIDRMRDLADEKEAAGKDDLAAWIRDLADAYRDLERNGPGSPFP